MKAIPTLTALLLLPSFLISCGSGKNTVEVAVSNTTGEEIGPRTIELRASDILERLGTKGFYITDNEGKEIPSQLTYDSLIVFKADVPSGGEKIYTVNPCDSVRAYDATVWGQVYTKRRDDVSYENELIGFRIYGPGTQQAGEKAYGYDIFFKHPTDSLIVPLLYAPETDDAVWAKVDSLRAVDNDLAKEFIKTFSYHIDHGLGMDCYAVGPTLGDGVAALADNDSIFYPWCYEKAEILDNGPLRFTVALDFAPREIEGASVTEHRILTLDSDSHLNRARVWYDGLAKPYMIVAGFPMRDDTMPIEGKDRRYIAYSDPTQGDDNGRALLGITLPEAAEKISRRNGHILMSKHINPTDTFVYKWGFAWNKADIPTLEEWGRYLDRSSLDYSVKIK